MTTPGTFHVGVIAMRFFAVALSLALPCRAEVAENDAFTTLQAEVQKSFREQITPFLTAYCTNCHGSKKMKGGINFAPALKNPGGAAYTKQWKLSLANVRAHDMPPEDV